MGEAKRRGTYEQRKAEGEARVAREIAERQARAERMRAERERKAREEHEKRNARLIERGEQPRPYRPALVRGAMVAGLIAAIAALPRPVALVDDKSHPKTRRK